MSKRDGQLFSLVYLHAYRLPRDWMEEDINHPNLTAKTSALIFGVENNHFIALMMMDNNTTDLVIYLNGQTTDLDFYKKMVPQLMKEGKITKEEELKNNWIVKKLELIDKSIEIKSKIERYKNILKFLMDHPKDMVAILDGNTYDFMYTLGKEKELKEVIISYYTNKLLEVLQQLYLL